MKNTEDGRLRQELLAKFSPKHPTTSTTPYEYWARVKRIVDADTMDLEVEVGFEIRILHRFRLIGVNAPEIHGVKRSSKEYLKGKKATEYVKSVIPPGKWVEIKVFTGQREKFGRWLCEIYVDGLNLNEELINKGHAIPYDK